ncbi:MAG: extracellular solute-binding protein [Candidatus Paceibacterota bacterium]
MKLRPFELTLVVIFSVLIVLALIILSGVEPKEGDGEVALNGAVSIWGTLPAESIDALITEIAVTNKAYDRVTYRYISQSDFDQVFVNALADGKGPDLVLIPHELLVKNRSKLEAFPYESAPIRDFRSAYIDGAEIFARNDGIYGFPIAVDPLVLYWNRDMFANKNLLVAPSTWEAVVGEVAPALTVRDANRSIKTSALAMGTYRNITNAFPVISMLLLQGGSTLVTEESSFYKVRLNEMLGSPQGKPFTTAMTFFTNFSSVSNTLYSWNRSLANDKDMFLREELAMYFGFASEARDIEAKNPNLNFDIAEVPQGAGATVKRTYGKFYTLVPPRSASNKVGAYAVMQELGSQINTKKIADSYNLAPVYRASLLAGSRDVYGQVAYTSAPSARGWLNPAMEKVDDIIVKLLDDVSANRSELSTASFDAIKRFELAY